MLGSRIAAVRKYRGLTQRQLARGLQLTPSAVGMYEQNRRLPTIPVLLELARLLDISVSYLLLGLPDNGCAVPAAPEKGD